MRYALYGLGLGAALLIVGCHWPWMQNNQRSVPPQAQAPTEAPTAAALVSFLNDNAQRVQSIDCRDLDLDARQGRQGVGLTGWMVCQKPKNFRMSGKVVGKQAVDMGSNGQEFWYWISEAQPPYLFHCSYEDFARGTAKMPFPFQPDWILEAMGIAEYRSPENYQVVAHPNNVELIEQTLSPQGQKVRKVTVFNRGRAQNQVTAHLLQDANGKLICAAYITDSMHDRTSGAILPRRLNLVWPAENMELKMRLDNVTVNGQLAADRVTRLFTRPNMANVSSYDLARGLDPTGPVQRTRGSMQ